MFADGLVVPEKVDERGVTLGVDFVEEAHVLFGGKRVLIPTLVGEAQCDVVAQLVGAQQQSHVGLVGVAVEIGRALPAEDVARALGEDDAIAGVA